MKDQFEKKKVKLNEKIIKIIDDANAKVLAIKDEIASIDAVLALMAEKGL